MESQKIENLLLTSFDATTRQREKSPELGASYDEATSRWEVAIRYANDLTMILRDYPNIQAELLIGNFGILRGTKEDLLSIATRDEVLYMEAAKRLFFSWDKERFGYGERQQDNIRAEIARNSKEEIVPKLREEMAQNLRIFQVNQGFPQLISGLDNVCLTREFGGGGGAVMGRNVLMAYLDTGIDYRHSEFIASDGSTRIRFLWDQTKEEGFYTKEQIQEALGVTAQEGYEIVPERDISGHGTHVAGIGSGNSGMAPESEILVVKLGTPQGGGAKTTELMRGVDACVRYAVSQNKPLALNISYGTNYGGHNGYGILEEYLGTAVGYGRNTFVIGAGNEGAGSTHYQWTGESGSRNGLPNRPVGDETGNINVVELAVGEYQQSFSLQIWKEYQTETILRVQPAGVELPIELRQELEAVTYELGNMQMLVFYGEPSPISRYQEIYLDFIPQDSFLPAGIWKIYIEPVGGGQPRTTGQPDIWGTTVDLWIPVQQTLAEQTGFLRPTPEITLTIPSTAVGVLSVGAFDQRFDQSAAFSGRGYTWATNQIKPDIVAPGVGIVSASPGGGYTARTGTSMATPFVTGAAALFMEWGIVRGQDSYLYGEKIKAYFIKGARRLSGLSEYPNPQTGWGALCIRDSLPR